MNPLSGLGLGMRYAPLSSLTKRPGNRPQAQGFSLRRIGLLLAWLVSFGAAVAPVAAQDRVDAGVSQATLRARIDQLARQNIDIELLPEKKILLIKQTIDWRNPTAHSLERMVFNAHAHYVLPGADIPSMAKTLELLRMRPSEVLGVDVPPLQLTMVQDGAGVPLKFRFGGSTNTDLEVQLEKPLAPGQRQTIELSYQIRMENKQGRWGYWKDVWFFCQGLIHVARIHDTQAPGSSYEDGWDPTPFYPWHQPFSNDPSNFRVRSVTPPGLEVASSGHQISERELPDGRMERILTGDGLRDFAWFASHRFEWTTEEAEVGEGRKVAVRVAAFKHHAHYAKRMAVVAKLAIETYSRWFGAYAWPQFTIVESFFGWNGNECGALVMIDERVFGMPHMADGFVEYLICHEVCHQWWYNLVGTDGFREPFLDEGLATSLSHMVLDKIHGHNQMMLEYPLGLRWLPPIQREDYRNQGIRGLFARGADGPIHRNMSEYGNIAVLFNMAYDKSSKVFDLLRERMGEAAYLEFLRHIVREYSYRQIDLATVKKELTQFTGRDWNAFFDEWFEKPGHTDWGIGSVEVLDQQGDSRTGLASFTQNLRVPELFSPVLSRLEGEGPVVARIRLKRTGNKEVRTKIQIRLDEEGTKVVEVPIVTGTQQYEDPISKAKVTADGDDVLVEVPLDSPPHQVVVDPEKVLIDPNPGNNFWRKPIRVRFTPLYTLLEETDLTNRHDRLNLICGPWIYTAPYSNPWYTRPTMVGLRVGSYQTQEYMGGAYAAYRTDFRDIVAGVDGLFSHVPSTQDELGYHAETRLVDLQDGSPHPFFASLYNRHTFMPTASLYQRPTEYFESFLNYSGNFLPYPTENSPGAERYQQFFSTGMHFSRYYQIPYWDPEAGYQFNIGVEGGTIDLNSWQGMGKFWGNFSFVRTLPDISYIMPEGLGLMEPVYKWFAQSRFAGRVYAGYALPSQAQIFSMGGGELLRGFDLAQRQGSGVAVFSGEWRFPILRQTEYDVVDHLVGLRNLGGAIFVDTGNVWANGSQVGPWATSVGAGLRLDLAFLGFLERSLIRLDMAQAIGAGIGPQFWFGLNQPF